MTTSVLKQDPKTHTHTQKLKTKKGGGGVKERCLLGQKHTTLKQQLNGEKR